MKTPSTNKTILCLGTSLIAFAVVAADYNQGNSASQGNQINQNSPSIQQNPPNNRMDQPASSSDSRNNPSQNNNRWSDTSNMGPMTSQQFVQDAAKGGMKEVHLSRLAIERSQNADVKRFASHIVRDHTDANEKLAALAEKKGLSVPATNSMAWNDTSASTDRTYVRTENSMNTRSNFNATTTAPADQIGQGREAAVLTDHQTAANQDSRIVAGQSSTYRTDGQNARAEGNWNVGRIDHGQLAALSGAEFDRAYVNAMVRDHADTIRKFEMAAQNLDDADLKKFADKTLPTLRDHYAMAQELSTKLGGTQGIERSQGTQGTQY